MCPLSTFLLQSQYVRTAVYCVIKFVTPTTKIPHHFIRSPAKSIIILWNYLLLTSLPTGVENLQIYLTTSRSHFGSETFKFNFLSSKKYFYNSLNKYPKNKMHEYIWSK